MTDYFQRRPRFHARQYDPASPEGTIAAIDAWIKTFTPNVTLLEAAYAGDGDSMLLDIVEGDYPVVQITAHPGDWVVIERWSVMPDVDFRALYETAPDPLP